MPHSIKGKRLGLPETLLVKIERHPLDREAQRLMDLTRRLGYRLRNWMDRTATEWADRYPQSGKGEGPLPDEDWQRLYAEYGRNVIALLREQRARQALHEKAGVPQLTDAEYEAELKEVARDAVRTLPADELQLLLDEREEVAVRQAQEAMS